MRLIYIVILVLVIVIYLVAMIMRRRSKASGLIYGPARDVRRAIIDQYADANHQPRTDITRPLDLDTRLDATVFLQLENADPASPDAYEVLGLIVESVDQELVAIDEDLLPVELISEPRRVVYIVHHLETEINFGGFAQYFFNPSGNFAQETPDILRMINQNQFANFVEQANSFFHGGPSRDRKARLAVYDEVESRAWDAWNDLNTQYFESGIECGPSLVAYVLEHPDEFFKL